jgi:hypothetical protein
MDLPYAMKNGLRRIVVQMKVTMLGGSQGKGSGSIRAGCNETEDQRQGAERIEDFRSA